jgi:hypothetical protein
MKTLKPYGVITYAEYLTGHHERLKDACDAFNIDCFVIGEDVPILDWVSKNNLYHLIHYSPYEHTLFLHPSSVLSDTPKKHSNPVTLYSNLCNHRGDALPSEETLYAIEWIRDSGGWDKFMLLQSMSEYCTKEQYKTISNTDLIKAWAAITELNESECKIQIVSSVYSVSKGCLNSFKTEDILCDLTGNLNAFSLL